MNRTHLSVLVIPVTVFGFVAALWAYNPNGNYNVTKTYTWKKGGTTEKGSGSGAFAVSGKSVTGTTNAAPCTTTYTLSANAAFKWQGQSTRTLTGIFKDQCGLTTRYNVTSGNATVKKNSKGKIKLAATVVGKGVKGPDKNATLTIKINGTRQ